jgi:hypothetical protein
VAVTFHREEAVHANTCSLDTSACSIDGRLPVDQTVSACFSPIHEEWIDEARRFLLPATVPNAPFWDRWSAVRYLNDQYLDRHRAERELVVAIRPFVTAREHEMLMAGEQRVAELRLKLDRVGRRRGTAAEFASAAAALLTALELWCAEIELATSRVAFDLLPPDTRQLLDHVVASARTRALTPA